LCLPGARHEAPEATNKLALRSVARRHQRLSEEVAELDVQLDRQVATAARSCSPCQPSAPTKILVSAGDDRERSSSEASFASLCETMPVEASSGKVVRHRLNRGGSQDADHALHMSFYMAQMDRHRRTREYVVSKPRGARASARFHDASISGTPLARSTA
jgi:transposase